MPKTLLRINGEEQTEGPGSLRCPHVLEVVVLWSLQTCALLQVDCGPQSFSEEVASTSPGAAGLHESPPRRDPDVTFGMRDWDQIRDSQSSVCDNYGMFHCCHINMQCVFDIKEHFLLQHVSNLDQNI